MLGYLGLRLLLIPPTLLAIFTFNFFIIQFAPGGPIENYIAQLSGLGGAVDDRFRRSAGDFGEIEDAATSLQNRESIRKEKGYKGLSPEDYARLQELYGFDKPILERYFTTLGNYLRFDFGTSFSRDITIIDLIAEKLPVSISLGLWSFLLIYLVSIPLGIAKARRADSSFDKISTTLLMLLSAIPGFLLAVLLLVLFTGSIWNWFPDRGLVSANFDELSLFGKITDYLWHLVLPIFAYAIGGFTSLVLFVKNSFIDQLSRLYVTVARAKGLSEQRVLYGHVFRNALLLVIAGMPAALVGLFFTGSLLIEKMFTLDGIGLLGYNAIFARDYPLIFATIYIFGLMGLLLHLLSDLCYVLIDPRISFRGNQV